MWRKLNEVAILAIVFDFSYKNVFLPNPSNIDLNQNVPVKSNAKDAPILTLAFDAILEFFNQNIICIEAVHKN